MKTISLHYCPRSILLLVIVALLGSAFFLGSLPLARADWLNDALDCNNLTFSTFFSGSGSTWSQDYTIKSRGASSAKSGSCYTGDPSYPSYSYIQTGVYGPGHLYFWWKINSDSNSYMVLYGLSGPLTELGGLASISGVADWTYEDVFIPPGYHVLQWRFEQENVGNSGANTGWLDSVAWLPTWPELVVRGMDNRVYYRGYDEVSGAWGSWDSIPVGATCDSPASAMFLNHLYVVVRGMDQTSLWYGTAFNLEDDREGFQGWWSFGGATNSAPTLTSNGVGGSTSDAMCLVVRGLDNRVYYIPYYYDDRDESWGWGGWNVIPNGYTCDSPAAAMLGNELIIVVRGMDGSSLWYTKIRWTDNTPLKGWTLISGATPSKPVLAAAQDVYNPTEWPTMLYLVVRGMDNGIWYRSFWPDDSPPSWGSWTKMTGATCDAPAACYWWEGWASGIPGNYLHVVVRGLDGATLWHTRLFQDSTWSLMNGATPSAPTLAG